MREINIKIETFFKDKFLWCFENSLEYGRAEKDINNIVSTKCEDDYFNEDFNRFKDGENRQSLLWALWEFQKRTLPDGWFIHTFQFLEQNGCCQIWDKDKSYDFYCPGTRIITFYDFSKELLND